MVCLFVYDLSIKLCRLMVIIEHSIKTYRSAVLIYALDRLCDRSVHVKSILTFIYFKLFIYFYICYLLCFLYILCLKNKPFTYFCRYKQNLD